MTAATSAPVLSEAELALLLESAQVVDATGLAPTADGYTATWDLNRAALEGWRWKAARVAGSFDFNADGASYNRSQMLASCERMIAQYQRRCVTSLSVATEQAEVTDEEE